MIKKLKKRNKLYEKDRKLCEKELAEIMENIAKLKKK